MHEFEDVEISQVPSADEMNQQPNSWAHSSPYYNAMNSVDEGMMEREDVRAEQQAESIVRVAEALPERKGLIQTQSSFFNDQESDSEDEKSNKLQKKIDRKTMQLILKQHSAHDLKVDSNNEKDCGPTEGKPSDTTNTSDMIGGEPDCEEEFVFQ